MLYLYHLEVAKITYRSVLRILHYGDKLKKEREDVMKTQTLVQSSPSKVS